MFTEQIIKNKTKCFFISPHLDDAVFSAGGLMTHLAKNRCPVYLVNIFTRAKEPSTLSAKKYLYSCGYKNAEELFSDRLKEDKKAADLIKARIIDLEYTDALWRKREGLTATDKLLGKYIPEFVHIYPGYRPNIQRGKVSPNDKSLIISVTQKIKNIIKNETNFSVFCPIALGKHVDHIITRDAVTNLNLNPIYWSDFPYSIKHNDQKVFYETNNLNTYTFTNFNSRFKEKLVRTYKTQFKATFPGGNFEIPVEKYHFKKI